MFRLPRPTPASAPGRRMVSPRRRILLFGGGLVCLWGALQLAPLPSTPPPSAPTTTVVAPPPGASATGAEGPARAVAARPPTSPARAATAGPVAGPVAGRPPAGREAGERRRGERGLLRPGNVLAFVLLAGGGAFAVVLHRRKRGIGPAAAAATPAMGVIGELSLGPGQAVRLVRVHDEVLVLGVAATGLTLLHRYPYAAPAAAPATADGAEAPVADAPPADGSVGHLFADVLRRYVPVPAHA